MATRCRGGRLTRRRITLDVKYVPISIERSRDNTCAGTDTLSVGQWERERRTEGGGAAKEGEGGGWGDRSFQLFLSQSRS